MRSAEKSGLCTHGNHGSAEESMVTMVTDNRAVVYITEQFIVFSYCY